MTTAPAIDRLRRALRHRRIARGFARRGPWMTGFIIDGVTYGGSTVHRGDVRVRDIMNLFPDALTILELGSLQGGQTFEIARAPGRHVLGVEGRQENVDRARFAQRCVGVDNVHFVCANLESTPPASFGRFDAVVCAGILYHLPRPGLLLDALVEAAPRVYISTHYATEAEVENEVDGMPGRWYTELGLEDPLSGMSFRSFWPTLPALIERLHHAGFDGVEVLRDEPDHFNGPSVALGARATG